MDYFHDFHTRDLFAEENPDKWHDYESMKGTLTLRFRGDGFDEAILNIHPGPSNEVDWDSSPWLRLRVQAYLGKICRLLRETSCADSWYSM